MRRERWRGDHVVRRIALMAIPNLLWLLVPTRVIVEETRVHLWSEGGAEDRVRA